MSPQSSLENVDQNFLEKTVSTICSLGVSSDYLHFRDHHQTISNSLTHLDNNLCSLLILFLAFVFDRDRGNFNKVGRFFKWQGILYITEIETT